MRNSSIGSMKRPFAFAGITVSLAPRAGTEIAPRTGAGDDGEKATGKAAVIVADLGMPIEDASRSRSHCIAVPDLARHVVLRSRFGVSPFIEHGAIPQRNACEYEARR